MNHHVTLLQFEFAWEVQAYLRFAGIPFEEQNAEYPSVDLTGELPQLCVDGVFLGKNKILKYLKDHIVDLDKNFSPEIQNEIAVYSYMIQYYLNPSYNLYKWSKEKTIRNYLSPIYSSILSFPYNYIYYRNQQNKYNNLINITLDKKQKDRDDMVNNIYRILNEKLHENTEPILEGRPHFLYGANPSSLDAIFFAHLAQVMEFPAGMQLQLLCYPELVNYYESIMRAFFSVARGEKTSDNPFIKQYGFHVSCQATSHLEAILPYKDEEHRAYDNIDLNEEKQNEIVIEEKEKTIEEKFAFREQLFFYAGLSLSVFAFAVMVDLFLLVC